MWLICRTLTRWWRSSVSPNRLFSSSAWMLQRTWVTSANCADSEQILWEIIWGAQLRALSAVSRCGFRRRSEEKTHDRRDENDLLTHWVQILQRNVRMARSSHSRDLFHIQREQKCRLWQRFVGLVQSRKCLALSSEWYKISHKRVIAWKSTRHDRQSQARISADPTCQIFKVRKTSTLMPRRGQRLLHAETTQLRHPSTVIHLWRQCAHSCYDEY